MPISAQFMSAQRLVWIALYAALIAVGGFIAFPLPFSPVPVTLQMLFVTLAGLTLGPKRGALAVLLYIAAGTMGLPVFAGARSGPGVLLGPTGGFLAAFVLHAALCGAAARKKNRSSSKKYVFAVVLAGCLMVLCLGALRLMLVLDCSFGKALLAGALPFTPGTLLQGAGAAAAFYFLSERRLLPHLQHGGRNRKQHHDAGSGHAS